MLRYKKGIQGENTACAYLTQRKMQIFLAQRIRTPYGEIDLLMQEGLTLVGVEVKTRKTMQDLSFSLSDRQKKRCLEALSWLKKDFYFFSEVRFDCVLIWDEKILYHKDIR